MSQHDGPTIRRATGDRTLCGFGLVAMAVAFLATAAPAASQAFRAAYVLIPGGEYEMGDHHGFVDPAHPSDEIPIHAVWIDAFYMATTKATCGEYAEFLADALARGQVEIRSGQVFGAGGNQAYCDTEASDPASPIQWNGSGFTVRSGREMHPVTGIRWFGAIAYCNWLSERDGHVACYDLATGDCDLSACAGYRLPTEAEWEYAGRGGQYDPYYFLPWGDDPNLDGTLANWAGSGDPWEAGPDPRTTPVGFYDGSLHLRADFGWPGPQASYRTRDNSNPWGLYDMSGNAWEWVNDWYGRNYYQYCVDNGITRNPPGPAAGDPMPDGLPYRGLRGGNWYNGQDMYGHGRVANRDPSYFRGPGDPAGPWFHIGFRPVRAVPGLVAVRILRHAAADRAEPRATFLPLDPARDFHAATASSPYRVPGDADPAAAPLIYYLVPESAQLLLTREASDVVLAFTP